EEALRRFNIALDLDPSNARIWHNAGYANRLRGQLKQAIFCYENSLKLRPYNIHTLHDKTFCHIELDELDAAENSCDEILTIDPTNEKALKNKETVHKLRSKNKRKWLKTRENGRNTITL